MNALLARDVLRAAGLLMALTVIALNPFGEPPPALATNCPGSDTFGYRCMEGTWPGFAHVHTDIGNHCDDCVTTIALPFPFTFYGTTYTAANVSSNGNLQFASSALDYSNKPLPWATFNDALFVYWDDLVTAGEGFGIFTETYGSAPNRGFEIEWKAHLIGSTDLLNFAIVLYETTNNIEFFYGNTSGINGAGATVGIQRGTGSVNFLQRSVDTATLTFGVLVSFRPMADVGVVKTGPATAIAGTNLTYTIVVTNHGPAPVQSVSLTDAVPAGTTFVSATPMVGPALSCSGPPVGGTGTLTCSIASLVNGSTATLTVLLNVSPSAANGGTITNRAVLASLTDDLNPSNQSSEVNTIVTSRADLSVAKTDTPDPVTAGNNLTYTITVQNIGPSDAQAVQPTDTVPANTTFASAMQTSGPSFTISSPPVGGGGTVAASIATMPAGASATFQLVVRVNPSATPGSTISNTAAVSSGTTDPSADNNAVTTTTTVLGANLSVTNSATSNPVLQGQNVTYTVTVSNSGPHDAQSFQLADNVPANTTFVSETHPVGFTCTTPPAGGTGTIGCTRPAFPAGGSATFTFTMRLNESTPADTAITNTATVSSTTPDPSAVNNTATATVSAARQNVQVGVTPSGGRLQATIRARNAACMPNNQLVSLHFTQTDNATVEIFGQPPRSGDFTVPVSPPQAQVSFFVNRGAAGPAATVHLEVTDGCPGTWRTLVGGGPNAY